MAATHGERKEYKAHGRTEDDIHPARHFQDLYAFNRGRGCVLTADLQLQCGGRPWHADRTSPYWLTATLLKPHSPFSKRYLVSDKSASKDSERLWFASNDLLDRRRAARSQGMLHLLGTVQGLPANSTTGTAC